MIIFFRASKKNFSHFDGKSHILLHFQMALFRGYVHKSDFFLFFFFAKAQTTVIDAKWSQKPISANFLCKRFAKLWFHLPLVWFYAKLVLEVQFNLMDFLVKNILRLTVQGTFGNFFFREIKLGRLISHFWKVYFTFCDKLLCWKSESILVLQNL